MVDRADLVALVAAHPPADERERLAKDRFLAELDRLERPWDEHADPVHVTASAVVVGARGTVLHRHRLLGTWLQPGGHLEPGESPPEAARREVVEETGLDARPPDGGPVLLRLDVHQAGAARNHTHLDLCYLLSRAGPRPHARARREPGRPVVGVGRCPGGRRRAAAGRARRGAGEGGADVSGDAGPAPVADNPLGTLLAVQDLDTAIAQHEHRRAALPERRALHSLGERAAASNRSAAEITERRDKLAGRLGHLEEQTQAVVARRKTLEDRLYATRGAAGRDLQAIEAEVAQLANRLDQLEEEELVVMEEQEPLDTALEHHRAELAEMTEESRQLQARVAELDTEIETELAALARRREEEAGRLPEALARRYEDLRRRLGGTGAARLVADRCDGCHLTLPAMEVDRIRHLPPDAVVTCDQCGRILVRASLAPEG